MTAKIIAFSKEREQIPEKFDRLLRVYLTEMTTDSILVDYVGNRMKTFVEKYANIWFEPTLNLDVPPNMSQEQIDALLSSIEVGIQKHAIQVQEMVSNIIFERLYLEIEIYKTLTKNKSAKGIHKLGIPLS